MTHPFDHLLAAKHELKKWGVRLASNRPLATTVEQRFPQWKYGAQFDLIVPQDVFTVEKPDVELLYLWGGDDIHHTVCDKPGNSRFLVFGSLCDGSYLAIDTAEVDEMKIGAFPFEECSSPDGMALDHHLFVSFPFQYHEYLNYLDTAPEFDDYLFGYGR